MPINLRKLAVRSLKSSLASASWCLNAGRQPFRRESDEGKVIILAYHRVVADIAEAERNAIPGLSTSVDSFRRHLEIIREQYEVLSLDAAVEVIRGQRRVGRTAAAITFDDGYRDVYEQAFPVLKRFGLPATVFIPTANIGQPQLLDHDRIYCLLLDAHGLGFDLREPLLKAGLEAPLVDSLSAERDLPNLASRLVHLPFATRSRFLAEMEAIFGTASYPKGLEVMNWEMVEEMVDAGITMGSHSDRHLVLTYEDEPTVEREILRSKQVLEDRLGTRVRHFAYPNGKHNAVIKATLGRLGLDVAVTTERRIARRGDDPLALGRVFFSEESTRGITGRYSHAVAKLRLAA